MSEIEDGLRAAMHAAVDSEEIPSHLLGLVKRRQRRRRTLVAAVAVLAAVAAVVPAAIAVRNATTPGPRPSTGHPAPGPSTSHPTPRPKPRPTKLTGQPWPAGTDLHMLILTNNGPAVFSTATGRVQPIVGLPHAPNVFFYRVEGGWTAHQFRGGGPCTPTCNEPQYFLADGSLTARRIGTGWTTDASDRAGVVWLESYPPDARDYTTPASAQLVTTAGTPVGPRYRLPAGYLMGGGVGSYLLLGREASRPPYVSVLWDPRTGKVIRRFDNVAWAGPEQIAWSPACARCQVQVLNVSTGTTVTTPIRGGRSGPLTDDGRLLALLLPSGAIGVYDTQSRALTVIPGTILANDVPMLFGWLDGSHRLVIEAEPVKGNSDRVQIAYWQPGDAGLKVATISLPGGTSAVVFDGYN